MRALVAALALAGAVTLAGCSSEPSGPASAPAPAPVTAAPEAPVPQGEVRPTSITYDAIGARSSLDGVGLNPDKTIGTPPVSEPGRAAWFDKSPVPGNKGPAIVLGHINGNGKPGVFVNLAQARPGQTVEIGRSDGSTVVYTVTDFDRVPKGDFPTAKVYSDTQGPELRLLSCGGDLDRTARSYVDNIIVYAKMTGIRPATN